MEERSASRPCVLLDCYARFLTGERQGMDEIVRATVDALLLFTRSLTGDMAAAEEIVDDAYVQIIIKKPTFENDNHLKAYLCGVCRHRAISLRRRRARRAEQTVDDAVTDLDAETLESRVLLTERDEQLHAAMAGLKEEYRTVLYLQFFEGCYYP